ncbi:MAG: 2Fe-2S iron-sulfur cluster binding domain-containing protein, partial [Burkholderiales bacterium]|nr:2Fe-2S iron-sulfur cluster binding domain-containing protein [Burkholderiales bacterium]
GRRGFVHVDGAGVLTIPDFAGNLFFNTLGNFMVNGQGGLVFADFETGDLLQLTGEAEVILDSPEIAAFQGAERIWRFKPRRIVLRPAALPMRWDFKQGGWSPNSLMTGSWEEAESRLRAAALANAWRPFRVASVVVESATVRSYVLEPTDGAGIAGHLAGQHLPIRVHLPGESAPLIRTYTLSVAPSDGVYRISVKREGRVSSYLHEQVRVGDLIDTRKPAGNFTIDAAETRPAVLLAAGIGITPMLAMLRHVVYEGLRKRRIRSTRLFYSARSKAERAFDEEIDTIARAAQGMVDVTRVLSQTEGAVKDRDFDIGGRIDLDLLKVTLPFDDYDFYLCGPAGFMQDLYDGLRSLNVADERIHAESFGPASLRRSGQAETKVEHSTRPASKPVPVMFMQSGKEARWVPGDGSLLQLAEARGLAPEYSCREGTCGTCRTRILQGAVAYASPPGFRVPADEALICCAVPAEPQSGAHAALQLDL